MLVSLKWLSDYIDIEDMAPEAVCQALTDIGLEVESVAKASAVPPEVVVGKVLTAVKHPNADGLRLCTVDIGQGDPLTIVCGAPNARPGIKVAVATVGAVLPGNFKIKKSKIRGEESSGMLCSEKELTISEAAAGIIELAETSVIGQPVAKAMGLDDVVIEVKVTPNRSDCLGYLGIARDLAAKLKRTFKEPVPEVARDAKTTSAGKIKVKIASDEDALRFVALYIKDVSATPSPAWLQKRLTASGTRPINLIVDATNYVMLEYSQPIHAYDLRSIRGQTLEARSAVPGEAVKTLDGKVRLLEPGDVVIADGTGAIGLAGIMGGEAAEVKSDTKEIVIEVATFPARRVRKTSRRLGLHTEASHRFERGVDIDAAERVAWRVAEVIARAASETGVGAPRVATDVVDVYPAEAAKRVIALRIPETKQTLALPNLQKDEIVRVLESLEFTLLDGNEDRLVFEIPFFRLDIEREADLVEEVARLIGYEKIPYQLPVMNIRPTPEDPFIEFMEEVRLALATAGFRETITLPFVSVREFEVMGLSGEHPLAPSLTLVNPLNELTPHMQTTLVPGLLNAALGNRRKGETGVRLFECGRGYFKGGQVPAASPFWKPLARPSRHVSQKARQDAGRPTERHWVAAVIDQPYLEKSWDAPETNARFHHGKAAVLGLARAMGLPEPEFRKIDSKDLPFLHPGAAAAVYAGGKPLGYVGELHPKTAMALEHAPEAPPVVMELDMEAVFALKGSGVKLKNDFQKFPPITRDVALLVDIAKTHGDFETAVRGFKKRQFLTRYRLFDVFQGDKLPPGKKSVAYTLFFQSPERTLADPDVEPELHALVAWLSEHLGAVQR